MLCEVLSIGDEEAQVVRLKNGECGLFKERCLDCGHDEFQVPAGGPNCDTDVL